MSYNLSEIKFTVETSQLTQAIEKLGQLKTAANSIKETSAARKESIGVQKAEIQLAKEQEKLEQAKLDTAKKQREASEGQVQATRQASAAVKEHNESVKQSVSVLDKQQIILDYMTKGYTKGQSSILALAQVSGAAKDEIAALGQVLDTQRRLIGGDPFDKSLSSLKSLKNEYAILRDEMEAYNAGMMLTSKQIRGLAEDKQRLIERMKLEGISSEEQGVRLRKLTSDTVRYAAIHNKLQDEIDEQTRKNKEWANSNNYVEKELEKVRFALSETNEELNRGSANSILRFENALKRSGKTVEEQTKLLAEYRTAQMKLQKAGGDRAVDYITRAVGPQITDIFVGLATGQSPLTVMLQQGGQLRDQFAMMGVESKNMSDIMRSSMKSMAVSVKDTALAVGALLGGAIKDTASGIGNFFTKSIQEAVIASRALVIEQLQGAEAAKAFKDAIEMSPGKMSTEFRALQLAMFAVGSAIVGATVALTAYAFIAYKNIKEQNELIRSLNLTGASLGLNTDAAYSLAKSLENVNDSVGKTVNVISLMGKASGFAARDISYVSKAAIELEKVGGPALEETVKKYSEIAKDPVKGLQELAVQTGLVNAKQIESIQLAIRLGDEAKARSEAIKIASQADIEAAKNIYDQMGYLSKLGIEIKDIWDKAWDSIMGWGRKDPLTTQLQQAQSALNRIEIEGGDTSKKKQLQEEIQLLKQKLGVEQKNAAMKKENSDAAKVNEELTTKTKEAQKEYNKTSLKSLSLLEYRSARLKEDFSIEAQGWLDKNKASKEYLSTISKYDKEYKDLHPAKSESDNSLAILKQGYEDRKQELSAQLQSQLAIKKVYQELELGDMKQNLASQNTLITKSFEDRYSNLKRFSEEWLKEVDKQIAKAPADKKANLQREKKEFQSKITSEDQKLDTEYIKTYSSEIKEALKAWKDVAKQLDEINLKEKDLIAQRKRETDLKISAITNDPEQQAVAAAKVDEQNRQAEIAHQLQVGKLEADRRVAEISYQKGLAIAKGEPTEALDALMNKLQSEKTAVEANIAAWEAKRSAMTDAAGEQGRLNYMVETFAKFTADITNSNFGQVLGEQFGKAAGGVGSMIDALTNARKAQKAFEAVQKETTDPEQKKKNEDKYFQGQINNYAKMSGAVKNFFGKKTAAAKAASAVETGLQAISIAMSIKETAIKLGGYIEEMAMAGASEATKTAAAEAGFLARSGIYATEIAAKFAAMMGPYGLAAAGAVIAMLGLQGAFSGGGSFIPSNEGTGTVFGDKSAKSQSLGNSYQRLLDTDTMQLKYSAGMLTSLRSIDNNTKVLGAALAQSGAIDISKSGEGIATGRFHTDLSKTISTVNRTILGIGTLGLSEVLGVGKLVDKIGKALYGKSVKIQGQGIISGEQNLGKVLSGGFDAQYFSDVVTRKKFLGATVGKSASTRVMDEGTAELDRQLTLIFKGMVDTLKVASVPLGITMQDVADRINSASVSIGKVDLQGLTGEQIQEKLQAIFSKVGDQMAQQILPGFEEFTKVGEGYYDTVTRVSTGVEYATNALDMLGISAINFKDIQAKQGDVDAELIRDSILAKEGLNGISDIIKSFGGDAAGMVEAYQSLTSIRESLAGIGLTGDLVGVSLIKGGKGLDELKSSISAFTGLLPEAEQLSLATESLRAKFKLLGIDSMPTTAEAFVSLVKGVDTTTESGKALLGKLLGLSDAFQTVADEAERIKSERVGLEEELLKLQTTEAEQRKKALESLDPSNRALQEQIWLLQDQKKATEELTKALESAGKSIQDEINRLRGVTAGSGSGTLQAQFAINTAQARSGNLDSLKSLPDLSKAIETAVMGTASTEFEVAKTKAWLAASLSETMKLLGMSTDSSGNVTVGSSLTGTTSGSSASGGTLVVDKTNQELLTELKVLNAKVADLEAAAVATALTNSKMHKILDRVAADGNNFSVVVNTETAPVQVHTV